VASRPRRATDESFYREGAKSREAGVRVRAARRGAAPLTLVAPPKVLPSRVLAPRTETSKAEETVHFEEMNLEFREKALARADHDLRTWP
jgi:hypothetical protein